MRERCARCGVKSSSRTACPDTSWAVTSSFAFATGTTQLPRLFGARRSLQRALSFSALLVAFAACGDSNLFTSPATNENVDRQYGVYALTGSSSSLPAAYQFTSETLVRPQILNTGALNFDIAFDISPEGKAVLMTAKKVVPVPPQGAPIVGMLKLTAVYDQLTIAPEKGYVNDSTATLSVGDAILVKIVNSGCVYGEPFYAKLAIDSINVAERRLLVRSLVNRNCGYRSLEAGVPSK